MNTLTDTILELQGLTEIDPTLFATPRSAVPAVPPVQDAPSVAIDVTAHPVKAGRETVIFAYLNGTKLLFVKAVPNAGRTIVTVTPGYPLNATDDVEIFYYAED